MTYTEDQIARACLHLGLGGNKAIELLQELRNLPDAPQGVVASRRPFGAGVFSIGLPEQVAGEEVGR